jgi:tRNA dimethylallyltransferase
MSESKIVIISGATACGKSQLALDFGAKKDIAIINCDSLQIYEGLPILSSQPSKAEQELIPHHLYSHLKPEESASVGLWLDLVKNLIPQILAQNKIPVIVGGTGMYISKLINGISKMPEVSQENRAKAFEIYEEIGQKNFQEKFGEGKLIDKQRLLRACEIYLQTGKPISFWQAQKPEKIFTEAKFLHLNLEIPREKLYQNCNLRFVKMLEIGALEEVEGFISLQELSFSSSLRVASLPPSSLRGASSLFPSLRGSALSATKQSREADSGLPRRFAPRNDEEEKGAPRNDEEGNGASRNDEEGGDEKNLPITKTLGFAEIAAFLQNKISKEEMLDIARQKTRNYAKRQLTYFRNQFNDKISFEDSKAALDFLIKNT